MSLSARIRKNPYLIGAFFGFAIAAGAFSGFLFALYHDLPAVKGLANYQPDVVTRIYAEDGEQIAELYREKRIWLPYRAIPRKVVDALVAIEDAEFFDHQGIRFQSILRALIIDIRKGKIVQGGSTITQQLAKVFFLTPDKKIIRKIKEALLALQLEKNYAKEEILELYCNQIYLGAGAYGFEAAAKTYFGKPLSDVTLSEAAFLAGLPQAPTRYSRPQNLNLALQRRDTVLSRMRETGKISEIQERAARREPIKITQATEKDESAPYFVELVRRYLETTYGAERVYREGLRVVTTLNRRYQKAAEKALIEGVAKINQRINRRSVLPAGISANGAIVALRPEDGGILALVGGVDYAASPFNRATSAYRQPGSGIKPLVYLAALEAGFTPADTVIDSPVSYPDGRGGTWRPVNYGNRFYGPITLRKALENSLNVATIKLLEKVGVSSVIQLARRSGIDASLEPALTLGLGAFETTPLAMTSVYATIANHGVWAKPYFIVSVTTAEGDVLEDRTPEFADAFRPQEAFVISKMLQGVVENGTGKVARELQREVAAKTGTTSDNRDAWFLGFTSEIAAGVWIGFDDNRSLGDKETGGATAGPIWTSFMAEALTGQPATRFAPPAGVVTRTIDRTTGKLATRECRDIVEEYFVAGAEPVEYCKAESDFDQRL